MIAVFVEGHVLVRLLAASQLEETWQSSNRTRQGTWPSSFQLEHAPSESLYLAVFEQRPQLRHIFITDRQQLPNLTTQEYKNIISGAFLPGMDPGC